MLCGYAAVALVPACSGYAGALQRRNRNHNGGSNHPGGLVHCVSTTGRNHPPPAGVRPTMDSSRRSTAATAPKPSKRTSSASVARDSVRHALRSASVISCDESATSSASLAAGRSNSGRHASRWSSHMTGNGGCVPSQSATVAQESATRFAQQRTAGGRRTPQGGECDPDRCISGPGGAAGISPAMPCPGTVAPAVRRRCRLPALDGPAPPGTTPQTHHRRPAGCCCSVIFYLS